MCSAHLAPPWGLESNLIKEKNFESGSILELIMEEVVLEFDPIFTGFCCARVRRAS